MPKELSGGAGGDFTEEESQEASKCQIARADCNAEVKILATELGTGTNRGPSFDELRFLRRIGPVCATAS